MFGHNEIVGRKYFEGATDRLYITSMFMTLQGEGPLRGEPAFFVRLAKCNLACSFCDTYFDGGDWFTFEELDAEIDRRIEAYYKGAVPEWAQFKAGGQVASIEDVPPGRSFVNFGGRSEDSESEVWVQQAPRQMALVITGGEPMLQTQLGPFLETQTGKFAKIQIESNGSVYQDLPAKVILVVSPKCVEDKAGNPLHYMQVNKRTLERADCLKFVMAAQARVHDSDVYTPYSTIPDWAHGWRAETGKPVFISPMNIYNREPLKSKRLRAEKDNLTLDDRGEEEVVSFWEPGLLNMEANQKNHEWAARYCVQHGLTFGIQVHLLASLA